MDIDIDWCLTCEKRVNGAGPYCSLDCRPDDGEDVYKWSGNDRAGIAAWASDIPFGAPAGSHHDSSFYLPNHRQLPPNLLKPHRRLVPPTLSVSSPPITLPPPSTPMVTPNRYSSTTSVAQTGNASMGQTSLRSLATDSSLVATPASAQPVPIATRRSSILDGMYSHVRSWVSPSLPPQQPQPHVLPPKSLLPTRSTAFSAVKVVSSPQSSHGLSDSSAVCWITHAVLVDKTPSKRHNIYEPLSGRKIATEFPSPRDEHPSFRTRGRKASRAAA